MRGVGRLRDVVWLAECQGDTRQTGGGYDGGSNVIVAKVWASIKPMSGNRELEAFDIKTKYPYKITIRSNNALTGAVNPLNESYLIVLYSGQVVTIHSIVNKAYHGKTYLEILGYASGVLTSDGKYIANPEIPVGAGIGAMAIGTTFVVS